MSSLGLSISETDARATIELLQALRRNEIVAIQGDRVYHPRHGADIPFFLVRPPFRWDPSCFRRSLARRFCRAL